MIYLLDDNYFQIKKEEFIMSNDLVKVFNNNEFGQVRTLMIEGVPWFVGKDVASILGYERETKAVVDHIDDEDRKMVDGKTQSHFGIELGQRGGWLINESGLYSLIMASKLPKAKEFKRWVTSEVLPTIRKTGSYGLIASYQIEDPIARAKAWIAEKEKQMALETQLQIAEPKAKVYDELISHDVGYVVQIE